MTGKNYAIVVGIDSYTNVAWNLDGAVQDALDFATWALGPGGVPPENLRLLLSPLPGRVPNIPAGVPAQNVTRATDAEIRKVIVAFRDGAGRGGKRLYFYYAGHGVSAPGAKEGWTAEPLLVPSDLADVDVNSNLFIGFSFVLRSLARARPKEQVFFFDACRDFVLKGYAPAVGTAVSPSISASRASTQYVFFATSVGQKSKEKGAGVFGKALLDGLRGAYGAATLAADKYPPYYVVRFSNLARYVAQQVATKVAGQKPRPDTDPGAPDLVLAAIKVENMPKVPLEVYVKPDQALQVCGLKVLFPGPGGNLQSFGEYAPPTRYPTRIELPPDDYYIQAQAPPQYDHDIKPWSTSSNQAYVRLSLKRARTTPRTYGRPESGMLPLAGERGQVLGGPVRVWGPMPTAGIPYPQGDAIIVDALGIADEESDAGQPDTTLGLGRVPTGTLAVSSDDPEAVIVVWGPGRRSVWSGTGWSGTGGKKLENLPVGSYRVALNLPEGGPPKEQVVELKATAPGEAIQVSLASPPPQLGRSQVQMLKQIGIRTERSYVHPSERLHGIAAARLASLLGFAAFAAHWPRAGDFDNLKRFRVASMNNLPSGASGVLALIGVSNDKPILGVSSPRFLNEAEVLIADPTNSVLDTGGFERLPGFRSAAQFSTQVELGPFQVELRLPGLAPTRYSAVGLPDRITVLIAVAEEEGQFDVQQYMLPLPNRNRMIDEFLAADPANIRRIELAQRYYANGQEIPPSEEINILLEGKWQDPLLGCIAGYSLLRNGQSERFIGNYDPDRAIGPESPGQSAMQNMLYFFNALPDSHVLAGLCQPEHKDLHFANAMERGVPIFSEGYKALYEWAKTKRRKLPESLEEPSRGLLPASPWTAWSVTRPVLLFEDGHLGAVPPGWETLEKKRRGLEQMARSVGRIEVVGSDSYSWVGTGFLAGKDIVAVPAFQVSQFLSTTSKGQAFKKGIKLRIDFASTPESSQALEFEVTEIAGMFEAKDLDATPASDFPMSPDSHRLILLRIAPRSLEGKPLPKPLPIASHAPKSSTGRTVCVIGYPALDARQDPRVLKQAFNDTYNVKRVQPGMLIGTSEHEELVYHDCFTAGGNSGSPVIDGETMEVLGLHIGGRANFKGHYKFNAALALWTLAREPLLKEVGINFAL